MGHRPNAVVAGAPNTAAINYATDGSNTAASHFNRDLSNKDTSYWYHQC
ncbi:MAG: hypothetical protein QN424_10485 [Nitrososphaeraceae archaeon]|nr:hypothetical protein [Nitrososphaeraceae archaeon]